MFEVTMFVAACFSAVGLSIVCVGRSPVTAVVAVRNVHPPAGVGLSAVIARFAFGGVSLHWKALM